MNFRKLIENVPELFEDWIESNTKSRKLNLRLRRD